MFHILKLLYIMIRELLFDPGESDFKSKKFNPRKFTVLIIIMMSFAMNIWLIGRFYNVATELHELQENPEAFCTQFNHTKAIPTSKNLDVKNPKDESSDS